MSLSRILNSPDEPAPVAPPAEPAPTPSVLGTDPTPPVPVTPPAVPEPTVTPAPATSLSQEEIDALTDKASRYDLFANDPVLASKIADHYRANAGITANKPVTPDLEPSGDDTPVVEDPRMQALSQKMVQMEIAQFQQAHPDMETVKEDMAALINKYGMNLEDSYKFAMSAKTPTTPTPTPTPPAASTTEDGSSAGFDQDSDLDRANVEKLINDPKATPRMEDAIDAALNYAKKVAAQGE